MRIISLILLTTSIARAETKAPELLPWPVGLPDAYQADDGSICLPAKTADAHNKRLLHYAKMPDLCQQAIDEEGNLVAQECHSGGWSTWDVIITVTAGLLVGVVAGGVGGFLAAERTK